MPIRKPLNCENLRSGDLSFEGTLEVGFRRRPAEGREVVRSKRLDASKLGVDARSLAGQPRRRREVDVALVKRLHAYYHRRHLGCGGLGFLAVVLRLWRRRREVVAHLHVLRAHPRPELQAFAQLKAVSRQLQGYPRAETRALRAGVQLGRRPERSLKHAPKSAVPKDGKKRRGISSCPGQPLLPLSKEKN
eukprot:scaffold774_cov248-Pinguiococcus_pyrenoidosus.AAC.17